MLSINISFQMAQGSLYFIKIYFYLFDRQSDRERAKKKNKQKKIKKGKKIY